MPFKRDPGTYREQLRQNGYALLKDVLSDHFLKALLAARLEAGALPPVPCDGPRASPFQFPEAAVRDRFRAGLCALAGLDAGAMALSGGWLERCHPAMPDHPAPARDRYGDRVSLYLPLYLGPGSTTCVFPGWRAESAADRRSPGGVPLYEELGDMVALAGTIHHARIRPRDSIVLTFRLWPRAQDADGRAPAGWRERMTA